MFINILAAVLEQKPIVIENPSSWTEIAVGAVVTIIAAVIAAIAVAWYKRGNK